MTWHSLGADTGDYKSTRGMVVHQQSSSDGPQSDGHAVVGSRGPRPLLETQPPGRRPRGRPPIVPTELRELQDRRRSQRMGLETALARAAEALLLDQPNPEAFAWLLGRDPSQRLRDRPRITTLAALARLARAEGETMAVQAALQVSGQRLPAKAAARWLRDLRFARRPPIETDSLEAAIGNAIARHRARLRTVDTVDAVRALQSLLASMTGRDGLGRLLVCQVQVFVASFPDVSVDEVRSALTFLVHQPFSGSSRPIPGPAR